jgi:flagellar biosynthetic protein FliR
MNQVFQQLGVNVDWNFTFIVATLIMTRIAMVVALIPFLVGRPVPGVIKLGFTAVMLVYLYPYLRPADSSLVPKAPMFLVLLYLKEAFYGISIGIAASIVFHAFEAAGAMIDNQRGAAQARLLGIQQTEQTSVFGNFNYLLGIVIFLTIGGHLFFFKAVIESYDLLPLFSLPKVRPDFLAMTDEFIRMTGTVLLLSLQLTAPILIAIFVADVILGIMSKAAPAINVWELGFAIRGVLGVLVYFLAIGLITTQMGRLSMGMIDQVEKVLRFLSLTPDYHI